MGNLDVKNCSLKDFGVKGNMDLEDRVTLFREYSEWKRTLKHNTYRVDSLTGSGSTMKIIDPYSGEQKHVISFVSNDYLGFSHHPKVIEASMLAAEAYGTGAGASPLIGGQLCLHDLLEKKVARFFEKEDAITFTAGGT